MPLTIAEPDVADLQDAASRGAGAPNAETQADEVPGAAIEEDTADQELSSSEDNDGGVLGDGMVPVEEEILPADLEDEYAWLFGEFASDDEQERVATAVPDTELMQDAEDVGVAVAVAAAEDEIAEPLPKRRRLREKQKPWGPWLTRPTLGRPAAAKVGEQPKPKPKPWTRHCQHCPGKDGSPCIFSTTQSRAASSHYTSTRPERLSVLQRRASAAAPGPPTRSADHQDIGSHPQAE